MHVRLEGFPDTPQWSIVFESYQEAESVIEYLRTCSEVCRKNTPTQIDIER